MRIKRNINRAKAIWGELDYAQRRLFEIQTGIDLEAHPKARRSTRRPDAKGPKIARRPDELEALYMSSN